MIYYNESLALNEAGFDVVDALMECPIYDKYESMIESITNYGFMNESEKIEFRILEENVFETIGNALKKAWEAIAKFFTGLIDKIKGFFGRLSIKKVKAAVDKKIKKEEEEIKNAPGAEAKARLIKKYGIKASEVKYLTEKNDKGEYTNYAFIDTNKLVKETINSNGLKNARKASKSLLDFLDKMKSDRNIKSNEAADKELKKLESIKIDEKTIKTVIIDNGEIKNKIQSSIDVSKIRSFFGKGSDGEEYMIKSKMANYIFDLSNINLMNNNQYTKMANEYVALSKDMGALSDLFKSGKGDNGYANKAINGLIKKTKEVTNIVKIDMHGMNQLSGAMLKAYKDDYALLIKIGSKTQVDAIKKDKVVESYDPWAGLEESNDPWAGLEESYDPWAGLE